MKKQKSKFKKMMTLDVDMLPKSIAERQAFEDDTLTPLVDDIRFNIEQRDNKEDEVSDSHSTPLSQPEYVKEIAIMRERYSSSGFDRTTEASCIPMGSEIRRENLTIRLQEDFDILGSDSAEKQIRMQLASGKNRWNHEFDQVTNVSFRDTDFPELKTRTSDDAYEKNPRHGQLVSINHSLVLTSQELLLVMKGKVSVRETFEPQKVFYSLFREEGVKDNFRGGLWCNLLDIYSLKHGHSAAFFAKLTEIENKKLEKTIDGDTIADRSDLLVNKLTNEYLKPDA